MQKKFTFPSSEDAAISLSRDPSSSPFPSHLPCKKYHFLVDSLFVITTFSKNQSEPKFEPSCPILILVRSPRSTAWNPKESVFPRSKLFPEPKIQVKKNLANFFLRTIEWSLATVTIWSINSDENVGVGSSSAAVSGCDIYNVRCHRTARDSVLCRGGDFLGTLVLFEPISAQKEEFFRSFLVGNDYFVQEPRSSETRVIVTNADFLKK